jgi:hypothetical protein
MAGSRERNERLAEAMTRAGLSSVDLATAVEVDPRTIDRWVADRFRTPRSHSRQAIADAVHVPVGALWPGAANGVQVTSELLALYPSRAAMPGGLVMSLLTGATQQVDVLALAGLWLWDAVAGFGPTLAAKASVGVTVRVCIGDPDGNSVRLRGSEEGIGDLLVARARLAATYARHALADGPSVIRLHDTTLYTSLLRFDDELLVNWHLYGAPASQSPVLHLRHTSPHGIAESSVSSFERVWNSAQALTA